MTTSLGELKTLLVEQGKSIVDLRKLAVDNKSKLVSLENSLLNGVGVVSTTEVGKVKTKGKSKSKKRTRFEGEPKKPINSYLIYSAENRKDVTVKLIKEMKEMGLIKEGDTTPKISYDKSVNGKKKKWNTTSQLAADWGKLSEEDQLPYKTKAKVLSEKYVIDMNKWIDEHQDLVKQHNINRPSNKGKGKVRLSKGKASKPNKKFTSQPVKDKDTAFGDIDDVISGYTD